MLLRPDAFLAGPSIFSSLFNALARPDAFRTGPANPWPKRLVALSGSLCVEDFEGD